MHQALPYRTWLQEKKTTTPITTILNDNHHNVKADLNGGGGGGGDQEHHDNDQEVSIKNMVSENAVILFGRRGCCMCHAMKKLLLMLGVNPTVYEVDEEGEVGVIDELVTIDGCHDQEIKKLQFPAVFIGGRFFGGLDRLMASHISGELVPKLKKAGALWL